MHILAELPAGAGVHLWQQMNERRQPTLKEIAQIAEVSEATVSRVVNRRPNVHPETVLRVTDAIRRLNLDIERMGRRVRPPVAPNVGLVVPDIMNPVFPMMMKGIQQVARTHGYNVIVCDSENDVDIERDHLRSLFQEPIDGLIWIPAGEEDTEPDREIVGELVTVLLDRKIAGREMNRVTCDNEDGAYQATRYLLSLGHRRILFVGGPKATSTATERLAGFERALEEQGVALVEELVLRCDFTMSGAHEVMSAYLSHQSDRGGHSLSVDLPKATAIFVANDAMAFGVLKALREHEVQVPEDMSIIGYDDIPYAEFVGLSTVAQPAFEMGRNAMILLIDVLEGRVTVPQRMSLRPVLTIRDSCRKL